MGVTTKEIADICGVSRGTVDRALNGRPGIKEDTRRLIMETAERMGYRPHLLARSLVKGRTMSLGLVVFDLYNRFFAQLANAVEKAAREKGYFVYLTLTGKEAAMEKECVEHLAGRRVDGVILCPVIHGPEYVEYLKKLHIPVVTVSNRIDGGPPFIGIDDRKAMKDAARHIIGKGYERILYVSPPLAYLGKSNIHAQLERYNGLREAIDEQEKGAITCSVLDRKDYAGALDRLLEGSGRKTAVLCSSDVYTLEVLDHLKRKGLKVPDDVGLMGFDNIDMMKYIEPVLSTVSYPVEEIGAKAVECLLKAIGGETDPFDRILPHGIVEGMSL